jgi:predicted transcriptional regulator
MDTKPTDAFNKYKQQAGDSEPEKCIDPDSNSQRFLKAYNSIDYSLRTTLGLRRNASFTEGVRSNTQNNATIRKFEEKLIDYARLRNAIIHHGTTDEAIAEPHENAVLELEHIAKMLATPPKLISIAVNANKVALFKADDNLNNAIIKFFQTGFGHFPVIKNNNIIGVLNARRLIFKIGEILNDKKDINDFLNNTKIEDVLKLNEDAPHFSVVNSCLSIYVAFVFF